MFFNLFVCLEILHCYTGLNGDPTIVENCCIEVDLVPQTNHEISGIFQRIDFFCLPNEVSELTSVASYYIEYVKKHTNSIHHKFLTRFVCLVVFFIRPKDKTDPNKYQTELLFNILSFAKLYEYSRCNKEMNDIEKARIVSLFKTGMKNIFYIHESVEKRPDKIEILCPLTIKNIETSCDLNSDLDFQILKNTYVLGERNIGSNLSNYLKYGSFEQIYSLYLYLKLDFLLRNWEDLNDEVIIFPFHQISFNGDFFKKLLALNLSLTKDLYLKLDQVKYREVMIFIAEPYLNTVLNQSSSFDSIFEFSEETFFSKDENISKEFPRYLLEFFIEKPYENQINLIYGFLDDISTPQFKEYILLVLCLKFPCFNQKICNKEILLRIILECIFLTNILSPENINVKGLISEETLEIDLCDILVENVQNKNIGIKIPSDRKEIIQRYIPETFKFLENMMIIINCANRYLFSKIISLVKEKLLGFKLKISGAFYSDLEIYFTYFLTLELNNTLKASSSFKPVSLPLPKQESQPEQETGIKREPETKHIPETKRETEPQPQPKPESKSLPEPESQPVQETETKRVPETKREPAPKQVLETKRKPETKIEPVPKAIPANKTLKNVHKTKNIPNLPSNTKVEQKNNGTNPENLTEKTRSSKLKKQESKILQSETESKASEEKPKKENNAFRTILIVVLVFTSVIGISATGYWIYLKQFE
ncbi:hypothetical protein CWI37_1165p0010 [Hamiltosporidium tvaerminnensis]|uniref:Uncharacterized protein n=1 Tax=Hamiltosporidium tvaerminnensis TaxID=1176355 RepID=A0A4Q9KY74_9MICR|nr:hypothetical protein LUQ84_000132 [Hamiltosporidium tvaerminnensis]TBT99936.1 hypothetical protein CWI37_1165p0010 [Hamiltosporidium tvaerminnensis]